METSLKNCHFCVDENQSSTYVADTTPLFQSILAKHFWFQESELLTFKMCSACTFKVMDFHLFYCNVEKLHAENRSEVEVEENLTAKFDSLGSEIIEASSNAENLTGEEVVKFESLESEIEEQSSNVEKLIVGDVAFEIVDVRGKIDLFEEVNIPENEVKIEEDVEPELLVVINNNETTTFECLNCDKRFEKKKIMELHMKIVHGDHSIARSCTKCAELEQALREVLKYGQAELSKSSSPAQCDVCDGRLQNMASLQRHLVWHWGEICIECRKKPKNYKPEPENNNEAASKVKPKPPTLAKVFTCSHCKKEYGQKRYLDRHVKAYHEFAPPSTDGCQTCKALDQALEDISEQDPSEASGRVRCGVCGDWLMSVASLQRHLAWHQSEPCKNCRRGPRVIQATVKQYVPQARRLPMSATSRAKKPKTDEASIRHICVYCGLCFDVYAELIKHQVEEHPKKRNCTYTSITPN